MNYTDSHSHIYAKEFKDDIQGVIDRCLEHNVSKIWMPNIDHTSIDGMLEMEVKFPETCIPMMGLHPCSVNKNFDRELYIVEEWLEKRTFAAVGEIGLDLYWETTFIDQQKEAFKVQIGFAKRHSLPIVIHNRNAFEETISMVEKEFDEKITGIFHCFTGTLNEAKRIIDAGFYLGIGGVVTFKNGGLDKVLPEINLEKIVLETDSPYLAPVPHRGKRNESSFIPIIAKKIADIKKVSLEEVAEITTENAFNIFKNF